MRVVELTLKAPDLRLRPAFTTAKHVRGFLARDYRTMAKKKLAEHGYPQPYFSAAHVLVEVRRRRTRTRNPSHELAWLKPLFDALQFDRPSKANPNGHVAVWRTDAKLRVDIVATNDLAIEEPYIVVKITEEQQGA